MLLAGHTLGMGVIISTFSFIKAGHQVEHPPVAAAATHVPPGLGVKMEPDVAETRIEGLQQTPERIHPLLRRWGRGGESFHAGTASSFAALVAVSWQHQQHQQEEPGPAETGTPAGSHLGAQRRLTPGRPETETQQVPQGLSLPRALRLRRRDSAAVGGWAPPREREVAAAPSSPALAKPGSDPQRAAGGGLPAGKPPGVELRHPRPARTVSAPRTA